MAVYPFCEKCRVRRENCPQAVNHKRYTSWIADWKPSRTEKRRRKFFGSELENPRELAETQFRQWKTDYERGELNLKEKGGVDRPYRAVADEWWTRIVVGENRIKDPARSEKSRFDKWCELFDQRPFKQIETDEIRDWIGERRESGIAINTINRDLKPLRWICDYAVASGYIEKSPVEAIKAIKGGLIHDRWMSEEEVDRLLWADGKLEDRGLMEFHAVGLNSGFRLGNLERLDAPAIEFEQGLIHAVKTKSGEPYSIPIAPAIEPLLHQLVRQHPTGPILIGTNNNVGERHRAAAKLAGLYKSADDPQRVTIHTMRHTFAVLYLKRGGDIYKLSKLLGHASVAITDKIYARFCPKEKLKEAPLISTPVPQLQAPALKIA